ncbi:MAG: DNA mismatch repair protein MutS [Proteobacteria bacterium]|nr:DNA mismatch repair protein MutS [Pseudomonadota bacterium]
MFVQYVTLKEQEPDSILFFRMGDFYEVFFEDARIASEVCELTLTSRNKGDVEPIPMAGVPHHAAKGYVQTLVEAGYKVAIADQVEDAKLAKGLVRREITRIVSPGLALHPEDLAPREACWLVAIVLDGERWGLASLDVSTGDLRVTEPDNQVALEDELGRIHPREVLLPDDLPELTCLAGPGGPRIEPVVAHDVDESSARARLHRLFEVSDLGGFGAQGLGPSLSAAALLVDYAAASLKSDLPQVTTLRPYATSGFMVLDGPTRRNLELTRPLFGTGRKGTLLGLLDRTATAMGGRLLREHLSYPLLDLARIKERQDAVQALVEDSALRRRLRELLKEVADLERLGSKLAQRTANARDLVALGRSLVQLPELFQAVGQVRALQAIVPEDLGQDLAQHITATLVEDPPATISDGGLFRTGFHDELDELIVLAREGKGVIAGMERTEREATDIPSLKVKYNKVFGYFLEVTRANVHKVPDRYIRKQTLTNAERYITPELKELEEKVLGADERRKQLELQLFTDLRESLATHVSRLTALAGRVAALDVHAALAHVAMDNRYVRPVVDESLDIEIVAGRHPVVEQQDLGERFVPNDLTLEPRGRRLVIVTGPNMSGKSTVMRQTALIALMAQIGSFVPADAARIGLCDRVFTRVGASDDLATGRSTFMVEMSETANILHHATERSLVLLDEIGRGTSTYDGLAIAWSVAEALHDRIRARTLFATHYHELVELADSRPGVANVSVAISLWGERILFLRRLKEGGASRSYGIQCARLAGMPRGVVERAKTLLTQLEKHAATNPTPQLALFGARPPEPEAEAGDGLRELLAEIDPDAMSPREALQALYRLKEHE